MCALLAISERDVVLLCCTASVSITWLWFADNIVESGRRLQASMESTSKLVDTDALEELILATEVSCAIDLSEFYCSWRLVSAKSLDC